MNLDSKCVDRINSVVLVLILLSEIAGSTHDFYTKALIISISCYFSFLTYYSDEHSRILKDLSITLLLLPFGQKIINGDFGLGEVVISVLIVIHMIKLFVKVFHNSKRNTNSETTQEIEL